MGLFDLLFIVLGILFFGILVLLIFYYYNKVRILSNRIDNAWAQIDVQLKRRTDLIPNLIESVKGYMRHEKKAIVMVTSARERMMKAGSPNEKMKASLDLTAALKTIFAIAENYPNLKANENFLDLQNQLNETENKIAFSRQFYNDTVLMFNNLITTIPGMWFAKFAGQTKTREYLGITEEERKPVKVKFEE